LFGEDERDAGDLADLLRIGRLPEAWIAPLPVRELRELTRYRAKLVGLRTSCKDQVHAVLAKLGVPVTCTDIFGTAGSAWLDGLRLPQPYAGKVTSLRHLAGELTTEITMLSQVTASLWLVPTLPPPVPVPAITGLQVAGGKPTRRAGPPAARAPEAARQQSHSSTRAPLQGATKSVSVYEVRGQRGTLPRRHVYAAKRPAYQALDDFR
jgi:hypothetical protein